MSRRRRVIVIVLGLLQLVLGPLQGFAGLFLSGRVGNPAAMEDAHAFVEELKQSGLEFPDEQDIRWRFHEIYYAEHQALGRAQFTFGILVGVNGLLFVAFGLCPSRKPKQIP